MSVRSTFESSLNELKEDIITMTNQVSEAFELALKGFIEDDEKLLDSVIVNDKNINEFEIAINEKITLMIAKQQPVATDLRRIIVALKISNDLERIGDLAVDIAKTAKRLNGERIDEFSQKLIDMSATTKKMLQDAMTAFKNRDILESQKIASLDDTVDKEYKEYIHELFHLKVNTYGAELITLHAFIGRYIERIADHATNLAEWVVYEVNGQYFDLN